MTLHQKIRADIKESMLAKDETRTLVLRGVLAEIQKELLAKKTAGDGSHGRRSRGNRQTSFKTEKRFHRTIYQRQSA